MRRRFSYGWLAVAIAVVIVAIIAINATHKQPGASADTDKFLSCPSGTPAACAKRLTKAWGAGVQTVPVIATPAGLVYDHGFITKIGNPSTAYFVFQTKLAGDTAPTDVTVSLKPASPEPFDAKHRGGKLRHLPSGRAYLDASISIRSGPFTERVGPFDVAVSYDTHKPKGALRTAQLALLDAVTEPK